MREIPPSWQELVEKHLQVRVRRHLPVSWYPAFCVGVQAVLLVSYTSLTIRKVDDIMGIVYSVDITEMKEGKRRLYNGCNTNLVERMNNCENKQFIRKGSQ